jgi:siroheme synthase (precorrin-2 oxidase/ferrochelatase)
MAELMRRQYLVTEENISKLEKISSSEGVSATEIVRRAIDAYHPNDVDDLAAPELMELVSERLKEAVEDTRKTRRRLNKTLKKLESSS